MASSRTSITRFGMTLGIYLVLMFCQTEAAEPFVHVELHLEQSTTPEGRVQLGDFAQLTLHRYNIDSIGVVTVNGTKVELSRTQPETSVRIRFDGSVPAVCRIEAGDASTKFLAQPGYFYACSVLTPESQDETTAPGGQEAASASTTPAAEKAAEIDHTADETKSVRKNLKRLKAEAEGLQNELNLLEARKNQVDAIKVEIAQLARQRDAISAIQSNSWVLRKKDGGVMNVDDSTLGFIDLTLRTQLQAAIEGIESRNREVNRLISLIDTTNSRLGWMNSRLNDIATERVTLEGKLIKRKKSTGAP